MEVRFTVDAHEGTVTGAGGSVRLEPKVMDVLRRLARNPGRVVARDELMDAVWPDVVVTEHTLSRCIYQLRNQLALACGEPDRPLIETLPKRGYRLLAGVDVMSAPAHTGALPVIPFVVGQWVRAERFYGRAAQIAEILEGPRNSVWLLGTRRIGKTSLLRQLEYIADNSRELRFFPLFWDFQGTATPEELHLNFTDALLDAEDRLQRNGIAVSEVEGPDLFASLERLRRRLRGLGLRLLLLCDEVEELIELRRKDPSLLRKLRRAMQGHDDVRTVLASTIRLWALADQRDDTSPFLHGFTPPLYIERLSDDEARALITQSHLPAGQRPAFRDEEVAAIGNRCNNHPYLLQLVCKRFLECRDLDDALEHVATDRMVSYFFAVDFDMLSDIERRIVRTVADSEPCPGASIREAHSLTDDTIAGTARRLESLGFLRVDAAGDLALANDFFRRWMRGEAHEVTALVPAADAAVVSPLDERTPPVGFLTELKRRKVFRVTFGYVIVAWLLLQIGEVVFGLLAVPVWAGKLLVVLLALGLPIAIFLAWAYELTSEGVKRERDIDRAA